MTIPVQAMALTDDVETASLQKSLSQPQTVCSGTPSGDSSTVQPLTKSRTHRRAVFSTKRKRPSQQTDHLIIGKTGPVVLGTR
jgi:hypothetical protein